MRFSVITPTHDPKHLRATWESLKAQTIQDWEWIVVANHKYGHAGGVENVRKAIWAVISDETSFSLRERVRIGVDPAAHVGVGQRKRTAFGMARGEILVELDHDDLLTTDCLAQLDAAFWDPEVGFAYSDSVDFADDGTTLVTYHDPACRAGWINNGWKFEEKPIPTAPEGHRHAQLMPVMFPPTALSMSLVYFAPNHVRAWRKTIYELIDGHDPKMELADDHDLIARTYLVCKVAHIPAVLYLYRVHGQNTWAAGIEKIQKLTYEIQRKYLEHLVLRQCAIDQTLAYDLGGGITPRAGWIPVDQRLSDGVVGITADLRGRWPFKTSSVGAFRAFDLLEHLPDKAHTMAEIHRCLRPGGWLLSSTPSTDGRGAWQDPTHVSYWNSNAIWYWTRREQARYIRNEDARFLEITLNNEFPSDWHQTHNIPYVVANLVALKDGYSGPGVVKI